MRLSASILIVTAGLWVSATLLLWGEADMIGTGVIGLWAFVLGGVATLVAGSQPRNPVGWLLLGSALLIAAGLFASSLARVAQTAEPGSGLAQTAGWFSLWIGTPAAALFVVALLFFPTGTLLSPRLKPAVYLAGLASALMTLGYAVKPGRIDTVPGLDNPVTLGASDVLYEAANGIFSMLMVLVGIVALVTLIIRVHRSRGLERQQLKWFVFAVAVFPPLFGLAIVADLVLDAQFGPGDHYVDFFIIMIAVLLIPISMGISILRYRLYEIDLIVNRTLVYAALTAILAGVYLSIVVVLQAAVASFATDSDIAIVVSTLVVAALFRPLRVRLQGFIDRRFYRRKYDARRTLEQFSAHLREQVELGALSSQLVGVVQETMQPRHASLWLRPTEPEGDR